MYGTIVQETTATKSAKNLQMTPESYSYQMDYKVNFKKNLYLNLTFGGNIPFFSAKMIGN